MKVASTVRRGVVGVLTGPGCLPYTDEPSGSQGSNPCSSANNRRRIPHCAPQLPTRLTAGHEILDLEIGVRYPGGQPIARNAPGERYEDP